MQEKKQVKLADELKRNMKLSLTKFSDKVSFDFDFKNSPRKKMNKKITEEFINTYGDKNTIILLDGELIFSNIDKEIKADTLKTDSLFFKKYKHADSDEDFFNYNKKNLNSGLKITISESRGKELLLKVIIAGINDTCHYSYYQIDENSKITVSEQFVIDNHCTLNYFSETDIQANSTLNLMCANLLNGKTSDLIERKVKVGEFANFGLTHLHLSSNNTINSTEISLAGKGSFTNINTAIFVNDSECTVNLVKVKHLNVETKSYLNNVGIVNDNAEINVDCLSIIEKGNARSESQQDIKIVNLTNNVKATANPKMIIDEFDVKAGHSAGVGVIDEEQIYYLMSRGLKRTDAMELLILSYINKTLEILGNTVDQKKILKTIREKIV